MKKLTTLTMLVLAVTAGAALAAENKHDAHSHSHSASGAKAVDESPYTLKEVMQDLSVNLSRIEHGIMTNNRLMVRAGAEAIAHHPNPKGGIDPYITKNRESVEKVVPAMDALVHDTAVEIAKGAGTETMLSLQEKVGKMAKGCVGCHNAFRD